MRIEQQTLKEALSDVGRFIPSRPTLPVLSNVKMEVNGNLTMTSTNLEAFCTKTVECQTDNEVWQTTVPFSLFNDYVNSLSGTIEIVYQEASIKIVCGKTEITIRTIDASEYPLIPEIPDVEPIVFQSQDLVKQLSSVVFAAATDENRPILTGVYFRSDGEKLVTAAADGYRMAVYTANLQGDRFEMVIPAKFIASLIAIVSNDTVTMNAYHNNSQAIFAMENVTLVAQLIEGQFPDFTQILPKSKTVTIIVDQKDLLHKIKQIGIIARKSSNILTISYQEDKVEITAQTADIGAAISEIEAAVDGEYFETASNYIFLVQALSTMSGKIVIEQGGSARPIKLYPENNDVNCHVIMPMHIHKDA